MMKLQINHKKVALSIVFLVYLAFSFYALGVLNREDYLQEANDYFSSLAIYTETLEQETDLLLSNAMNETITKTKILPLFVSKNTKSDMESSMEEYRIAIGAEDLLLLDAKGEMIYSTDSTSFQLKEEFKEYIGRSSFQKAIYEIKNGKLYIIAAVSMPNQSGLIQASFYSPTLSTLLQHFDISNAIDANLDSFNGALSIVDLESEKVISHSDPSKIGFTFQIPLSSFSKNQGSLSESIEGYNSFVWYQKEERYLFLYSVPKSSVYRIRNIVIRWEISLGFLLLFSYFALYRKKD